jgi:molybdopterin-containing oxidoreductase family iron-sulfur binding subunit
MALIVAVAAPGRLPSAWRKALGGRWAPHTLVGETDDAGEAARLADEAGADLFLLDLASFERAEAIELCRELACDHGGKRVPVVALAPVLDDEERTAVCEAGATGYVLTTIDASSAAVAFQAIAEVAGGPHDLSPGAPSGSRTDFIRWTAAATVLALVAPGHARAQETDPAPSPSAPGGFPELPPETEGESDVLRMQRELLRAMGKPVGERRWTMVMDLRKCSGCDACTIACKAENQLPPGVVYRPVIEEEIGTYPNVTRRFLPRPCMQCEKPPCTPVCPVGATWRRADGVVAIDYDKCIGCRYCIVACPYSARSTDSGHFYTDDTPARQPYELQASPEYDAGYNRSEGTPVGNARKCHFCLHRLEAGQLPACVSSCIGHATYFGDASDPDSLVAELVARPEARRLKEELGTEPRVYYLT